MRRSLSRSVTPLRLCQCTQEAGSLPSADDRRLASRSRPANGYSFYKELYPHWAAPSVLSERGLDKEPARLLVTCPCGLAALLRLPSRGSPAMYRDRCFDPWRKRAH